MLSALFLGNAQENVNNRHVKKNAIPTSMTLYNTHTVVSTSCVTRSVHTRNPGEERKIFFAQQSEIRS